MARNRIGTLILIVLPLAVPARADMPPPPGVAEREHAAVIRAAGYACDDEPTLARATREQFDEYWRGRELSPRIVHCKDGHDYLVALPSHLPQWDTEGRLTKPPEPVVLLLK